MSRALPVPRSPTWRLRITCIRFCMSSGEKSSIGLCGGCQPALLTMQSIRSNRSTAASTRCCRSAVTLTSDFVYSGVIAEVLVDDFECAYTKMHRPDCEQCAPAPPPAPGGSAGLSVGAPLSASQLVASQWRLSRSAHLFTAIGRAPQSRPPAFARLVRDG